MPDLDVTDKTNWGDIDGESLALTKCACGYKFGYLLDFIIGPYRDSPHHCPGCGRALYFKIRIQIFEIPELREKP